MIPRRARADQPNDGRRRKEGYGNDLPFILWQFSILTSLLKAFMSTTRMSVALLGPWWIGVHDEKKSSPNHFCFRISPLSSGTWKLVICITTAGYWWILGQSQRYSLVQNFMDPELAQKQSLVPQNPTHLFRGENGPGSDMSGSTPAASTRQAARSSPGLQTPCLSGTRAPGLAMHTSPIWEPMPPSDPSRTAGGSLAAGSCRNSSHQAGWNSTMRCGRTKASLNKELVVATGIGEEVLQNGSVGALSTIPWPRG